MAKEKDIYLPPMGGTDLMMEGLHSRIDVSKYGINVISSRCLEEYVEDGKINILWQHLNIDEPYTRGMMDRHFVNAIDAFVFVSHWQYERFKMSFNVDSRKSYVIKNAINPIAYTEKPKNDKLRLIYTSMPFRGLEVLLDVVEMLDRSDIETHIYSHALTYGTDYNKAIGNQFEHIYERASNTNGVVFHGHASNATVIKSLQEAHIFAYPSIFEETSCLSMIEAGAAACALVSTNVGALKETGSEYAVLVPMQDTRNNLVSRYAKELNTQIENYWTDENVHRRQEQALFFNNHYSWDKRIKEWQNLFESLSNN